MFRALLVGLTVLMMATLTWGETQENQVSESAPSVATTEATQRPKIPPLPPPVGSPDDRRANGVDRPTTDTVVPVQPSAPRAADIWRAFTPPASPLPRGGEGATGATRPVVTVLPEAGWPASSSVLVDLLVQQPPPADPLPVLPPTRVIGESPPGGATTDQFSPTGPPGTGVSGQGYFGPPGEGTGGRGANLMGTSPSASQGTISQENIQGRPAVQDQGQLLEAIPGVIATTQSTGGHATSYLLRGFALDEGTDFAFFADGVPVNMRSHAHSQGYSDLNFLIPELIRSIDFFKGPYYPEVGDFSNVGYANFNTVSRLPEGFAKIEGGMFNWWRMVVADSPEVGPGVLLYGIETQFNDGPWTVPERQNRYNAIFKYTVADDQGGLALSFLGYHNDWNESPVVPLRAINSGLISRFGNLDPSQFGVTNRFGGNLQLWERWEDNSLTQANVYLTYYELDLFSNFTYFLNDPENGDQIQQLDQRWLTGVNLSHQIPGVILGEEAKHIVGVQVRQDWIPRSQLHNTVQRQFLSAVFDDNISEFSGSLYYKQEAKWAEKVRTMAGMRGDYYNFTVDAHDTPENSGNVKANIFSPKGSVILGPWADTEFYLNAGMSFHSNAAQGVTQVVDPNTGDATTPIPGLVQGRGAEVGYRTQAIPNLVSTTTLWYLEVDSELVFIGDEGATEASPPSHRYGLEFTNYYQLNDWLSIYADYSNSYARFVDFNEAGPYVPNSLETVVGSGIMARSRTGLFASLSLRRFGPRPLVEDNSIRSGNTSVFNLRTGWERRSFSIIADFLNLFDSDDADTTFYYASRLPGEPAEGVSDLNVHPVVPFTFRLTATYKW